MQSENSNEVVDRHDGQKKKASHGVAVGVGSGGGLRRGGASSLHNGN